MSHFAQVNEQSIVEQVIVAEQDFIDMLPNASSWIQTSYNTYAGQHPEGRPLRKNYAGIGFTYDADRDAFIPPRPFASWVLNETTCLWETAVEHTKDGETWSWDEASLDWVKVTPVVTLP